MNIQLSTQLHSFGLLMSLVLVPGLVSAAPSGAPTVRQLSDDVYLSVAPAGFKSPQWALPLSTAVGMDRDQCQARIQKSVCSTTVGANEISYRWDQIQCDSDSATFVPALMDLFDEMPERMRPSFCTLAKIFISDGITSTAFASPIQEGFGKIVGGYIGIRKSTFLNQPDSIQLMTWKEQLPFGGSTQFLQVNPDLVHLNYGLKLQHLAHDGLFYVLSHELGHLIDFDNGINSKYRAGSPAVSWQSLSWLSSRSPIPELMYKDQDDFCYYNCGTYLEASAALSIYQSLSKSAFITTYAGVNSMEDFAEYWAWYQMTAFKSAHFVATIPGQGEIDLSATALLNPVIQKKFKFVDQIWNDPNLKVAH